jgi:L-threonylcarbamoyladenylate synthase
MNIAEAARLLNQGGVLVYPTETLYALGCAASSAEAAARVASLKGRPQSKPFPLIVADMPGLWSVVAPLPEALRADVLRLAEAFWPGPLSVLLPTRPELPPLVRDGEGYSSLRVSPHPTVQNLCRALAKLTPGAPAALVATSANKSGLPAAALPGDLDPALLAEVAACGGSALLAPPLPGGGAPSTLLRLTGSGHAQILRQGAVPASALAQVFTLA